MNSDSATKSVSMTNEFVYFFVYYEYIFQLEERKQKQSKCFSGNEDGSLYTLQVS